MMKPDRVAVVAALAAVTVWNSQGVIAKNQAAEFIKYFNPVQKKGYLNESQDRLIKKKKFKSMDLPGAQPVFNKEIGLFALLSTEDLKDDARLQEIVAKPSLSGLSVLLAWSELEPEEGKYQWDTIDKLLKLCEQNKKSLILRVTTAGLDTADSDTPKWVFTDEVKSFDYTGADGKTHKMPIFWDDGYLAAWSNFINALGERYDKNPNLHSIGITGGGLKGGTQVVPNYSANKEEYTQALSKLQTEHKMSHAQLVEHWKYVADMFPKAFPTATLNFDIDPPTPNRKGEDTLDEISDYLIYRYGQRVYLTRQNMADAKHKFDQWRILLKFRPDTVTGYQLTDTITGEDLNKLATKFALEDGISFAEVPSKLITSQDAAIAQALETLRSRLGYQVVTQKVTLPEELKAGDPLKASFTFLNLGSAPPMRPTREFDKDRASSYKIELELRDEAGKPVVQSLHTPTIPTNQWASGAPISWETELRMPNKLKPGKYSVYLSMVDVDTKRKIQMLNALSNDNIKPESSIAAGTIKILD